MADPGAVARNEHEHVEHGSHVGRYAIVWIALLALTILTYALSRLHIPGGWGVVVALSIATAKGALVALFFMHLWDQRGANRLVFVTSLVFVALLIGLTLSDNATRFRLANPPGSEGALPLGPTDYPGPPPAPPAQRGVGY
ncbi:MAG TPA: cytochrome C oxidase subunit IV family protein [Anaeromyxobacter sp.]|nr:cytochrome C oxidase subunit IV family protein [Anaeromyxobacter sp.]